MLRRTLLLLTVLALMTISDSKVLKAQALLFYDIGTPALTEVYISPTGDDANDGATPESALRTLTAAWERIPTDQPLATGYHVLLLPGTYTSEEVPNYWESRYGTFEHPVIVEAAQGRNTVFLPNLNIFDARYLYFINVNLETGGDTFHCERCDHLLLRGSLFVGADPDTYNAQETVKINQSQYVYLEDNFISGAWDNAVDFVAVQYGHIAHNHITNAGDWCMYAKGGSAYLTVWGNEFDHCGTGGFSAGQGTGYQFMVEPWIQYEGYDIKFVDNIIHDTAGAGVGVQGGYDILIARNLFYRIGERSHLIEFGFGSRSCDGQPGDEGREGCDAYHAAGGWGNNAISDGTNYVRIPNKNVYFYANLIYNPPGYQSAYQHFSIFAPTSDGYQADSNVPLPARADENLQIVGNTIWNGGAEMPLGVEANPDFPAGCQAENPTCNEVQIRAQNAINGEEPDLIETPGGAFVLPPGAALPAIQIPDFPAWDVPVPEGTVRNMLS